MIPALTASEDGISDITDPMVTHLPRLLETAVEHQLLLIGWHGTVSSGLTARPTTVHDKHHFVTLPL